MPHQLSKHLIIVIVVLLWPISDALAQTSASKGEIEALKYQLTRQARINTTITDASKAYAKQDYAFAGKQYAFLIDSLDYGLDAVEFNLANCYFKIDARKEASDGYTKVTKSINKQLSSLAWQQLAYLNNEDIPTALQYCINAMKDNPSNDGARYNYELLKRRNPNAQPKNPKDKEDKQNKNKDQKKEDSKKEQEKKTDTKKPEDSKNQKPENNTSNRQPEKSQPEPGKDQPNKGKEDENKGQKSKPDNNPADNDKKSDGKQGQQPKLNPGNEDNKPQNGSLDQKGNPDQNQDLKGNKKQNQQSGTQGTQIAGQIGKNSGKQDGRTMVINKEALRNLNLTEDAAKSLLETMKNTEVQYLQQRMRQRKAGEKQSNKKPEW